MGNDKKFKRSAAQPGKRSQISAWHKGKHINFMPNVKDFKPKGEFPKFPPSDIILNKVLSGWLPSKPFINKETVVTAFGSCFAAHIYKYLNAKGYNLTSPEEHDDMSILEYKTKSQQGIDKGINFHHVNHKTPALVNFRAGVNTTFAVRQLLEWVYENKKFDEETWYGDDKKIVERNDKLRQSTLKRFKKTEVFIITLGLSEIWENIETGAVFWRAIPEDKFDKKKHKFRVSSFSENKNNIQKIYDILRKGNPQSTVIFTLSPISLAATFRKESCLTANTVSKALLRSAVDEFYRDNKGSNNSSLYYWPSYEIVKEVFSISVPGGPYTNDNRHIKAPCVGKIMKEFEKYYVV